MNDLPPQLASRATARVHRSRLRTGDICAAVPNPRRADLVLIHYAGPNDLAYSCAQHAALLIGGAEGPETYRYTPRLPLSDILAIFPDMLPTAAQELRRKLEAEYQAALAEVARLEQEMAATAGSADTAGSGVSAETLQGSNVTDNPQPPDLR
jgi:hypothetical protein